MIERGYEEEVVRELFNFLKRSKDLPKLFVLEAIGPASKISDPNFISYDLISDRAAFEKFENYDSHIQSAISSRHRKDIDRKERRLSDKGELTVHWQEHKSDPTGWVEEFLKLEQKWVERPSRHSAFMHPK